jgi:hypothetical protein
VFLKQQLGDAIAGMHQVRLVTKVAQEHTHFPAIISINDPRTNFNAVPERQA